MRKFTAEQRLERSALAIMKEPMFCQWAGLLFVGKRYVVDDPSITTTACVDNQCNTYYHRKFIEDTPMVGITDKYVNFYQLHETGHKAMMHLQRGAKLFEENPALANAAADHVTNLMIHACDPEERFQSMVYDSAGKPKYFRDPQYKGMSLHEVYYAMKRKGETGNGGGSFDRHHMKFTDLNRPFQQDLSKTLQEDIEIALRTGGYLASKQGNRNAQRLVGEMLAPQVRWQDQLADFIRSVAVGEDICTWNRPMRRFIGMDMYLPSTYSEAVGKVVFAVDESGSVTQEENNAMLTELVSLCRQVNPSEVHLVYWSDGIAAIEVYLPHQYDSILATTKPRGGGGTYVIPVAEYVNTLEDVQCAIISTDGGLFGGWGDWNVPTLWAITRKHVKSPVGKTIYLNVEI